MELFPLIRLLLFTFIAFGLAIVATPVLTHFLYKYKLWKPKVRQFGPDGDAVPIIANLQSQQDSGTPRMGGLLIWLTVVVVAAVGFFISKLDDSFSFWNLLNRSETWLPMFTLVAAGIIGFFDDFFVVKGKGGYAGGGIAIKWRILLVLAIGLIGAWWFTSKLGFNTVFVPLVGNVEIGWFYGPLFILVLFATFSSGVVDGLDGLSGGVFSTIFLTYAVIAYSRGQYDLATFCGVLLGATFAYLWFNIPPARFYMGETGILALTTTLTVVAFLTNAVLLLPIAGIILVLESGSVQLQLLSKKFRHGKKIFLAAPIHHHFEAQGWPSYKVTMRFWVISAVFSVLAFLVYLIGPH
ncbi:MAG: hypothetical protein A3J48_03655 [Candidatus Doudnabacteria bacterium RIFCSPHIGHO2_02_FULL_46_11]|uniref:Phospho-N-acetylmuramoyl-pentapeptide-transferase n=1 Tax=Candidatus Doudnabacteria bacterium RIFCSPHIGHO2_02_FULL_46_11 TaxID=1817832 RepID=A0A1F5P4V7_9BACT|nr:MAG: hypothetical protein A3J48_03655 [Candidatus Doudnabacteria bacterium RIFCSPHIGHO2_02_FULL_46_11]